MKSLLLGFALLFSVSSFSGELTVQEVMQITGQFVGVAGTAVGTAISSSVIATLGFVVASASVGYGVGSGIVAIDEALFKGAGIELVADYGIAPVMKISEEAKDLYDYYKSFMKDTFSEGDL